MIRSPHATPHTSAAPRIRRALTLLSLFILLDAVLGGTVATQAFAAAPDFKGDWVGWVCPAGQAVDPARCSSLALSLAQEGAHVCGAHLFATAGAGALDEGDTPSLTGRIEGNVAHASVISRRGGSPVELHVDLQREGEALLWKRLDSPAGDYLLPQSARLTRSTKGAVLGQLVAQRLAAVCSSALTLANQAPPAAPPAGANATPGASAGASAAAATARNLAPLNLPARPAGGK